MSASPGSVGRACLPALFMMWLALVTYPTEVAAGGVDFAPGDQTANAGPSYLGVVTDQSGAPVADARVSVKVARFSSLVIERSDSQGHFFVQGFDKSISPAEVDIACAKDGYASAEATKSPTSDSSAPINVVCALHKE